MKNLEIIDVTCNQEKVRGHGLKAVFVLLYLAAFSAMVGAAFDLWSGEEAVGVLLVVGLFFLLIGGVLPGLRISKRYALICLVGFIGLGLFLSSSNLLITGIGITLIGAAWVGAFIIEQRGGCYE